MSEQLGAALILTVVFAASGFPLILIARAGTRRSLDWSWGGHTAANTPKDAWDEAHYLAGPIMERSGWLMTLTGVIGGPVVAWNEVAGLVTGGILLAASLGLMGLSILKGLQVLGTGKTLSEAPPSGS